MSKLKKPIEPKKPKVVDKEKFTIRNCKTIDVETSVENLISQLNEIEDKKQYLDFDYDSGDICLTDKVFLKEDYDRAVKRYLNDMVVYKEQYKQYILDMTEYINQGGEL